MKHFKTTLALVLFAVIPLLGSAASFQQRLQQGIAARYPHSNPIGVILYLQKGVSPSSSVAKEVSFWQAFYNSLTGKTKKNKISAVAVYLYNMYVTNAVYKRTVSPYRLDFDYIGVLDCLYENSGPERDFPSFYEDNRDKIKADLAVLFKQKGFYYNVSDPANTACERAFMATLSKSQDRVSRYGYSYNPGPLASSSAPEELRKAIGSQVYKGYFTNKKLVAIYKEVDVGAAIDQKNASASNVRYYYRPVNEECAACTYTFCRMICKQIPSKYSDWHIIKIYSIFAYPRYGNYVTPAKGSRFVHPFTKKLYPVWDYHAASLLVLGKGSAVSYLVADNMLLSLPESLGKWALMFSKNTNFIISPFRRRDNVEKEIVDQDLLSSEYNPYPVR